MPELPDSFRDFGILPPGAAPPAQSVRSYLPLGHVIGQYIGSGFLAVLGVGLAVLFALTLQAPVNVLASAAALALSGYLVSVLTRNDYSWVELDGETIRAKHLYTRRVVERPVEEIEDLLTLVSQVQSAAILIAEAWLGRVRGVAIRFRDKRTPLRVWRADPAMKNARELIEAIIFRRSEKGQPQVEVVNLDGSPLIRRIYWEEPGRAAGPGGPARTDTAGGRA